MKNIKTRNNYMIILAMVALAAACFQMGTAWLHRIARAEHPHHGLDILSISWGASQSQTLRLCISNPEVSPQSSDPTETVSLHFAKIQTQAGNVVLERELRVPVGEFRCVDISYDELAAAGLDPDPTTGATPPFLVVVETERVGMNRTTNVGAAESITVGAVQSIDVATGKIELYQSFQIISAGRN